MDIAHKIAPRPLPSSPAGPWGGGPAAAGGPPRRRRGLVIGLAVVALTLSAWPWVSVAAPVPAALGRALGARADATRRVALVFCGKPYTVRDLTTVGYRRGMRMCERVYKEWPPGPRQFVLFGLGAGPQQPGESPYIVGLERVLHGFLEYQVVRQMERQYHPDTNGYVDRKALLKAIAVQSKIVARDYRFLLHAVANDGTFARYYADLKKHYPSTIYGPPSFMRTRWRQCLDNRANIYSLVHCFPAWNSKAGEVGPWSRYWIYRGIVQIEIGLIYKQNPAKYIKINNTRWGQWHLAVVAPVSRSGESRRAALRLIRATSNGAGQVAFYGLGLADAALAALGSPTRANVGFGEAVIIGDTYGLKASQLRPRALIRTSPRSAVPHGYAFLLQATPPPASDPKNWAPGSDLFQTTYDAVLLPIARRVLRETRPVLPGLKLPSAVNLTRYAFTNLGYLGGGTELGRPVPKAVLRVPWPPLR